MKIMQRLAIALVGLVVIIVGFIVGVGFFLSPQDKLQTADIIVAVSGGETEQRANEAISLYRRGYAPRILFSGAAADKSGPSNAAAMRNIAIESGVPAADIMVEEDSADTRQNAVNSAVILRNMDAKKIILVTSPYHQRRASTNFRQELGPNVMIINHSATDSLWSKSSWWSQPESTWLTLSELQKALYVFSTKPSDRTQ
ncbi:YdcF family protein [Patescibacteria group bacterium]|nr:MAG: YdcF family protein [Patescibacteria group bacterium]